ncbi:MAG: metallopeptidase family protein [Paracoccaceae bacterium]
MRRDPPACWREARAPDTAAIEALAREAAAGLPAPFAAIAATLVIRVEEFADEATLDELGIENALELTGLYEGRALTERAHDDPPALPDTVRLFRRAILDEWADRGDVALGDLVTHVLVHEIAHHLGWSDDDIAAIDPWWT